MFLVLCMFPVHVSRVRLLKSLVYRWSVLSCTDLFLICAASLMFGFKGMTTCLLGCSSIVLMLGVEGFAGEFTVELCIRMFVDFDHDQFRRAVVARSPVSTIRYTAFYLRHLFYHPLINVSFLSPTYTSHPLGTFRTPVLHLNITVYYGIPQPHIPPNICSDINPTAL